MAKSKKTSEVREKLKTKPAPAPKVQSPSPVAPKPLPETKPAVTPPPPAPATAKKPVEAKPKVSLKKSDKKAPVPTLPVAPAPELKAEHAIVAKTSKKTAPTKPAKVEPTAIPAPTVPLENLIAKAPTPVSAPAPAAVVKTSTPKKSFQATPKTAPKKPGQLRILFVAPECVPFAKTGGLGDVVAGLSKALHRLGHDVRVVMPLYQSIDYVKHGLKFHGSACIHMGGGEENWVGIHTAQLDGGVEVWFVDYGRFYHRSGLYSDGPNDYTDNAYRYGLLCKAAMQFCKDLNFIPDVMHLHDWPAAPTAALLKTWDRVGSPLSETASVLTIHNIGHQGKYHAGVMSYYGLGNEHFTPDKFEDFTGVNLLKAGIHFADAITTVSPTHAHEIVEPIGGQGLERHLQRRLADISGILNGVDYEHWHPETDKLLPARYSAANLKGKATCKAELQKRLGLDVRANLPLFGIVSRFASQKGFDLLTGALPRALNAMSMQLVVLGTGDMHTEGFFNWLASIYPRRVGVYIGFSNELSHLIEAGSDFFVMPSLYEPCGLNQIYSMAYGTLPLVRATGGLADTVENYDQSNGNGTGFVFGEPTVQALYDTIGWAVSTWYDRPQHYKKLQQTAMKQQFLWDESAKQYVEVYKRAKENRKKWA